jgi:hypothetical protein
MPAITIASTAANLNLHQRVYDKDIRQAIKLAMKTEGYMRKVVTDNTYVSPNVKMTDVVQAYQYQFTPKNDAQFNEVSNTLTPMKIDILFTADELKTFHDSWMVEWFELGKPLQEWSFPRYLWDKVIMPAFEDNMEAKIVWGGTFQVPVAGTAGLTVNSVDGLGTKLTAAITANKVVPYTLGAFTPTTYVAKLEQFCANLPLPYRYKKMNIYCSPEIATGYYFDRRERFGRNIDYKSGDSINIEAYGKTLVPLESMSTSQRVLCTPDANVLCGTKRGVSSMPVVRWQEFERQLKGLSEFWRFYGFGYYEEVFCNELP